ncbi:Microcystin-dependent protein [Spirosomataceae bacterium TFI 002]|nr:Microcystin-dependent protein [Spirosomataceae bacterium TFI 002]
MEPFIGQLLLFAGNFAPRGWAFCQGQLLPISQNTALFSILGTLYGGDGETTFGLPDLRGRVPVGVGSGPGLSPKSIGQKFGNENHTITESQLPPHSHAINATSKPPSQNTPQGASLASGDRVTPMDNIYAPAGANNIPMAPTGNTGSGQAFNISQPSLGMNYIIALQGIFPSPN